jgi:hypothetical protein
MKTPIVLIAFLSLSNIQAATFDQSALWNLTTTKQAFTFDQFNPQWGTLQSAKLTIWESNPAGYVNIVTKIFSSTIREIRSKLQLSGDGITSYDSPQVSLLTSIRFSYLQPANKIVNYVILSNQRLIMLPYITEVSSLVLDEYIGRGQTPAFGANAWVYISKTPEIFTTISAATFYAPTAVTLTYDYLPAPVPEPSTYGILVGMMALVYRTIWRLGTKKPCVAGL